MGVSAVAQKSDCFGPRPFVIVLAALPFGISFLGLRISLFDFFCPLAMIQFPFEDMLGTSLGN